MDSKARKWQVRVHEAGQMVREAPRDKLGTSGTMVPDGFGNVGRDQVKNSLGTSRQNHMVDEWKDLVQVRLEET